MSITNLRKLLLLGMLNNTEMHGYLLNAHLGAKIPIEIKKPTAYNILDKMEQDGWVTHEEEYTGERCRKIYSLTHRGKKIYIEMLEKELSTFHPGEFPDLVSIGLIDSIPKKKRIKLLLKRRSSLEEYIKDFIPSGGKPEDENNPHKGSSNLIFTYIRRSLELQLSFLEEVISCEEEQ
jgi:DNA-binding PadR family transcriptional regulator